MKKIVAILCLLVITLSSAVALAHGGRTDRYGGHTDSRTGQYHKH